MNFNHTYSIGDIIVFAITHRDTPPNSIGDKYLKLSKQQPNKWPILQKIVNEYNKKITPPSDEIVIHLRAGNVVENDVRTVDELLAKPCIAKGEEGKKRLSPVIYVRPLNYHILLQNAYKKKNLHKVNIFIGGHMCTTDTKSKYYLKKIKESWELNGYKVKVSITNNTDDDFVYMCRSKYFVSSGGGYSSKIQKIRIMNGIEDDLPCAQFGLCGTVKEYKNLEDCIINNRFKKLPIF